MAPGQHGRARCEDSRRSSFRVDRQAAPTFWLLQLCSDCLTQADHMVLSIEQLQQGRRLPLTMFPPIDVSVWCVGAPSSRQKHCPVQASALSLSQFLRDSALLQLVYVLTLHAENPLLSVTANHTQPLCLQTTGVPQPSCLIEALRGSLVACVDVAGTDIFNLQR